MKPLFVFASLRSFGLGSCAAVLALACGGSTDTGANSGRNGRANGTASTSDINPSEDTCADNPLLIGCPAGTPTAPSTGINPGASNTPASMGNQTLSDPAALAKAAAENVLASDCGQCHGPALTPDQAKAGMNYINDIDKLVQEGKIVPLNSQGSLIIQRMQKGEMPPRSSGLPPVTQADIDTVAQYIDNPRYWPNDKPADCSDENQLISFDALFRTINQDLIAADSRDTPFYRYVSLSNRYTAGACPDTALVQDRRALIKMMNMLSVDAKPGSVVPIDPNQIIYRIDLRDFAWNRPIAVDGQAFTDVWEATANNNPFNIEWIGDDANIAKQATGTRFPVQMADMMMRQSTIGNLYYAIIGVDVNQPIGNFIANVLGIDVKQDLVERDQVRAGTTKSRVSRQDRLVQRDEIQSRPGVLWQSFDFVADNANQSIFQDPFDFVAGGREAIFSLPNGMMGYLIADENGILQQDSDILLDTSQDNFRAVTSISCSNCHASGFIPVVDEVKAVALQNARDIGLTQDQIEELQQIYVDPTAFAQTIASDNASFYQSSLQRVRLPIQGSDPVSAVWLQFDADVTLPVAAGDLGITPDDLRSNLDLLNPALSVLSATPGSVDRDDFTALYLDSLCRLSTLLENVPDPETCAEAANAADALDPNRNAEAAAAAAAARAAAARAASSN